MPPDKQQVGVVDIICEFFEVAIHNILFIRKIYPETIFKAKRKYGVVVYQSIHPEVSEYIADCMKAVHFHMKNNKLKQLSICFVSSDKIHERFVFDVVSLVNNTDDDPFVVNLESCLRDFCVKLHTSHTYLDDLPGDATFSIQIHTTESSSTEFNQNPSYEDFSWVQVRSKDCAVQAADIVPVHTIEKDNITLQMYIEKEGLY